MAEAAVVRRTDTIKDLMSKPWVIDKLRQLVPKHLSPEKMARVMVLTISRDPKLQVCTPQSLLRALMRCAQIGLEPDGTLVHLIPYGTDVQIIVDWKGLVEIARRNGVIAKPIIVHENDDFEYSEDDGSGRTAVRHRINPKADRGPIIGAYSRARTIETGDVDYEWMSIDEIESIRNRSQAKNKGPWATDYSEMCRKTPLRRHAKRWPMKLEDRKALEADDDKPTSIKVESEEPDITIDPPEPAQVEAAPEEPQPEEAEPPPLPKEEPATPGPIQLTKLQKEVWTFLKTNNGTYDILQSILVDLKTPEADKWGGIYEVPDAVCKQILASKRTIAVRMRHLASAGVGEPAVNPHASTVSTGEPSPEPPQQL